MPLEQEVVGFEFHQVMGFYHLFYVIVGVLFTIEHENEFHSIS